VTRFLLPSLALLTLTGCLLPQQPAKNAPAASRSSASSVSSMSTSSAPGIMLHTGSAALVGERVLSGGILEYGAPDAPHTLLAVVNYGSSYARSFLAEQFPRLAGDFIKPGMLKVRILPLDLQKYAQSEKQSLALLCAAAQKKGLAMSETLAASATVPEGKAITAMGIDLKTYQACLTSPDVMRQRGEQLLEMRRIGVTLVPTFFLDEQMFTGLQDYPDLRGRIRERMQDLQD
jgi:protein-disulfide isomerase